MGMMDNPDLSCNRLVVCRSAPSFSRSAAPTKQRLTSSLLSLCVRTGAGRAGVSDRAHDRVHDLGGAMERIRIRSELLQVFAGIVSLPLCYPFSNRGVGERAGTRRLLSVSELDPCES